MGFFRLITISTAVLATFASATTTATSSTTTSVASLNSTVPSAEAAKPTPAKPNIEQLKSLIAKLRTTIKPNPSPEDQILALLRKIQQPKPKPTLDLSAILERLKEKQQVKRYALPYDDYDDDKDANAYTYGQDYDSNEDKDALVGSLIMKALKWSGKKLIGMRSIEDVNFEALGSLSKRETDEIADLVGDDEEKQALVGSLLMKLGKWGFKKLAGMGKRDATDILDQLNKRQIEELAEMAGDDEEKQALVGSLLLKAAKWGFKKLTSMGKRDEMDFLFQRDLFDLDTRDVNDYTLDVMDSLNKRETDEIADLIGDDEEKQALVGSLLMKLGKWGFKKLTGMGKRDATEFDILEQLNKRQIQELAEMAGDDEEKQALVGSLLLKAAKWGFKKLTGMGKRDEVEEDDDKEAIFGIFKAIGGVFKNIFKVKRDVNDNSEIVLEFDREEQKKAFISIIKPIFNGVKKIMDKVLKGKRDGIYTGIEAYESAEEEAQKKAVLAALVNGPLISMAKRSTQVDVEDMDYEEKQAFIGLLKPVFRIAKKLILGKRDALAFDMDEEAEKKAFAELFEMSY